jgi:hypothetical protein
MLDIVIAVYVKNPYAEFQGDRQNLDFISNVFDTNILENFKNQENSSCLCFSFRSTNVD